MKEAICGVTRLPCSYCNPCCDHRIEGETKMNDNLKISVEIIPYTKDIDMDFEHPVHVKSVWNHDELVEIEHDGHSFIVGQSELDKAISRASHFRW